MLGAYFDGIWRFLRRMGMSADDASDGVQDVMLVATRRIKDIDEGKEKSFLFSTAFRVATARKRKNAGRRETTDEAALDEAPDERPGADASLDDQRARVLLDRTLSSMPDDLRTVFVFYELEDMSMADIASTLGIPQGTVASRLRRAREEFTTRLDRLRQSSAPRGVR
jgi:RNA polymerase sigma-70 factor (ECF subfamily)